MKRWIFPCNVRLYDPIGAFLELHDIDWRQSVNLEEGDEVFIYCSKPYQKIMFRTVVKRIGIPPSEVDTRDLKYSKENEEVGDEPRFGYARLSLVKYRETIELSLNELVKHGIKKAPQGPMNMPNELYNYVIYYLC